MCARRSGRCCRPRSRLFLTVSPSLVGIDKVTQAGHGSRAALRPGPAPSSRHRRPAIWEGEQPPMNAPGPASVSRRARGNATRIGLFVVDRFPMAPLSMVIEALRLANWIEGEEAFEYVVVSADGRDRISSCDFPSPVSHSVETCPPLDVVLVCAGSNDGQYDEPEALPWLRALYRSGARVGGISSGALVLARAGLLEGRSCAVHWATAPAMRENFRNVTVSGDIFCIDGARHHLRGRDLDARSDAAPDRAVQGARPCPAGGGRSHLPVDPERPRTGANGAEAGTGVSNSVCCGRSSLWRRHLEEPFKVTEIATGSAPACATSNGCSPPRSWQSPRRYYMQIRLAPRRARCWSPPKRAAVRGAAAAMRFPPTPRHFGGQRYRPRSMQCFPEERRVPA